MPDKPIPDEHDYPSRACMTMMEHISTMAVEKAMTAMRSITENMVAQYRDIFNKLEHLTTLQEASFKDGQRREKALFGEDGTGGVLKTLSDYRTEMAVQSNRINLISRVSNCIVVAGTSIVGVMSTAVFYLIWEHITKK